MDRPPEMTDQQRADAFVAEWTEEVDSTADLERLAVEMSRALAELFGAVRIDERRAIAAFIRADGAEAAADDEQLVAAGANLLADDIERGEHGS